MRAIGFTGEARHGKDTAANMLADHLREQGKTVRVTAWANKLKVSAARALGMPTSASEQECVDFCDWLKEHGNVIVTLNGPTAMPTRSPWGGSGRQFLEKLGTEGGREVHGANVWVDLALPAPPAFGLSANAGILAELPDWHIDTTTRFDSEVTRIREWDGWIIRVERPSVDNGLTADDHVSRAGIPREQSDATIINDGSLAQLRAAVYDVFGGLLIGETYREPFYAHTYNVPEDLSKSDIMAKEEAEGVNWQAGTASDAVAKRAEVVREGKPWA